MRKLEGRQRHLLLSRVARIGQQIMASPAPFAEEIAGSGKDQGPITRVFFLMQLHICGK